MIAWLSIDPARKSGVAAWDGSTLVEYYTVKPRGIKGAWYTGQDIHESQADAWYAAYFDIERVVIERGFGGMATAVRSQGIEIGWHRHCCAVKRIPYPVEVNVSEWRRCIKEELDVSWPKDSKRCKALSVRLVRDLYGVDVSEDEADAILIGVAAMRMRLIDVDAE